MQPPAVSALLFLSLAHLTASAPAPQNNDYPLVEFIGRGQLRTISVGLAGPRYQDVGCLNSLGQWTTDEPQCGVFQAVRPAQNNISLSALPDGWNCGIDHVKFRCGADVGATIFGTWGKEGPAPGRESLRYAQYGVFATDGVSPPKAGEPPLDIHFYTGTEKGEYAWLGWKALE